MQDCFDLPSLDTSSLRYATEGLPKFRGDESMATESVCNSIPELPDTTLRLSMSLHIVSDLGAK